MTTIASKHVLVTGGASALTTNGTSAAGSFGGNVVQTLFDRGRIRQQIEIQSAVQEQAVIAYESTVLTALQEAENALVSFANSRARLASLTAAAGSAVKIGAFRSSGNAMRVISPRTFSGGSSA